MEMSESSWHGHLNVGTIGSAEIDFALLSAAATLLLSPPTSDVHDADILATDAVLSRSFRCQGNLPAL